MLFLSSTRLVMAQLHLCNEESFGLAANNAHMLIGLEEV